MFVSTQTSRLSFTQILPRLAEPHCFKCVHDNKIKLLFHLKPFLLKCLVIFCVAVIATRQSRNTLCWQFCLHTNQTLKLIEINSTEWQKSDDHTWDQLVLPQLASLGFSFQHKRGWYLWSVTCQHRYRSHINITAGDERFRDQSVGSKAQQKTCS